MPSEVVSDAKAPAFRVEINDRYSTTHIPDTYEFIETPENSGLIPQRKPRNDPTAARIVGVNTTPGPTLITQ